MINSVSGTKTGNQGHERLRYTFGRTFVTVAASMLLRLDIQGRKLIPDGPKIFVANHPTTMDPGLLTLVSHESMRMLISETLFKVPLLGSYLRRAGHIPVMKGQGKQALDTACAHLDDGGNIGIFIEGTLSPFNAGNHAPRSGTLRMALRTGVPMIPVGIYLDRSRIRNFHTTVDGIRERSRWCFGGPYAMTIGEPIHVTGDINDWDVVRRHSDFVMHHVMELAYTSQERSLSKLARRMHYLTGNAHIQQTHLNTTRKLS